MNPKSRGRDTSGPRDRASGHDPRRHLRSFFERPAKQNKIRVDEQIAFCSRGSALAMECGGVDRRGPRCVRIVGKETVPASRGMAACWRQGCSSVVAEDMDRFSRPGRLSRCSQANSFSRHSPSIRDWKVTKIDGALRALMAKCISKTWRCMYGRGSRGRDPDGRQGGGTRLRYSIVPGSQASSS